MMRFKDLYSFAKKTVNFDHWNDCIDFLIALQARLIQRTKKKI